MERCDCNLHDHIKSEVRDGVAFDSENYTWISYQILVALDFLHSHGVVHGDLKPANVLLILNGNIVKLCDFGLSRAIAEGHSSTQLSSPQGGTSGWLAPEILEGATQISKLSDIFPCGLIFNFTWSHGKHAYGDRAVSRNHYILEGTNQDLSRMMIDFVDEATTLLERMFQRNPADRPSTRDILQNPIFRRFGLQPARVNDAQVAEIFDQSLTMMSRRRAGATTNLNEDPLMVTPSQLQTAMEAFFERNHDRVAILAGPRSAPMHLGVPLVNTLLTASVPQSNSSWSQSRQGTAQQSLHARLRTARISSIEAQSGVSANPETTSPKQFYALAQPGNQAVRNSVPTDSAISPSSLCIPMHPVAATTNSPTLEQSFNDALSQSWSQQNTAPQDVRPRTPRTSSSNILAQSGVHANPEATSPKQLYAQPVPQAVKNPLPTNSDISPSSQWTPMHLVAATANTSTLEQPIITSFNDALRRSCSLPNTAPQDVRPRTRRTLSSNIPVQSGVRVNPEATSPKQLNTPDHQAARNSLLTSSDLQRVPRAPMCCCQCDFVLMSRFNDDRSLLHPLVDQIIPPGSKICSEFMICTFPKMIQERLLKMSVCRDGITTIIFVVETTVILFNKALDENNFRRFLQSKGTSGENLDRIIRNIRANLAVFALSPDGEISQHHAKVAVNVNLVKDGRLRNSTRNAHWIEYNARFDGHRPSTQDFINHEGVVAFVRSCLRLNHPPLLCAHINVH